MSDKTTYESLDNRIAPEALTEDHTKGLAVSANRDSAPAELPLASTA